ncbi:hypothetical protein Droror1_Dr00004610 [Drosera rotundifolia]
MLLLSQRHRGDTLDGRTCPSRHAHFLQAETRNCSKMHRFPLVQWFDISSGFTCSCSGKSIQWLMTDAQNCSLLFGKIQMSIIAIQKHLEGKSGEKRIAKTKKIRIKNLVKSYSQFGSFPIYTWQEKSRTIEVWAYIHILCTWKRKMKQNCARGRER